MVSWGSSYPRLYPTAQELRRSMGCHNPLCHHGAASWWRICRPPTWPLLLILLNEHFILWLWRPSPAHRDLRKWCRQPFLRLRLASSGERGEGCRRARGGFQLPAPISPLKRKKKEVGFSWSTRFKNVQPSCEQGNHDFRTLSAG